MQIVASLPEGVPACERTESRGRPQAASASSKCPCTRYAAAALAKEKRWDGAVIYIAVLRPCDAAGGKLPASTDGQALSQAGGHVPVPSNGVEAAA